MKWYKKYLKIFEVDPDNVTHKIKDEIRFRIDKINSNDPLVSVVVIAYNEEMRVLSSLWSLSCSDTSFPFEIIGVDNNSSDLTPDLLKSAGVRYYKEEKQGAGYARQKGLDVARGEYILCADADTLYPPHYIEEMVKELKNPGTASVCASYSYVPSKGYPRFWMRIYERLRDIHLFFLSFRNPVWCVRGAVFGHKTQPAREVGGYRVHLSRGEDGAMAYDLMEFGKLKFKRGNKTRAYTCTKALGTDGHFVKAFIKRAWDSIIGLRRYFFFTGDSDELAPKNKNRKG